MTVEAPGARAGLSSAPAAPSVPAAIELIGHARQEFGYGAARTRLWLQRVHGIRLAMGTIQRVFRDIGMKLFEKAGPGESVQVDVKYVRIADR